MTDFLPITNIIMDRVIAVKPRIKKSKRSLISQENENILSLVKIVKRTAMISSITPFIKIMILGNLRFMIDI